MVFDVRHQPGLLVHLDVGGPVPIGLTCDQPRLARIIGEHPAGRVGDGEGEASTRSQHSHSLGHSQVDVADKLQGAEC